MRIKLLTTICIVSFVATFAQTGSVGSKESKPSAFKFAFMTDTHLNRNNSGNGNEGLKKALESAKQQKVDFVIFGGDNADIDGLPKNRFGAADSLAGRFKSIVNQSGIKAYFTIGNHDRFYSFDGTPDPDGFRLFEKHFGPSFYSFDHKSVHFVVLNSVQKDSAHTYFINKEQVQWLENDLKKTASRTPIVAITHVPFQSLYYPAVEGKIVNWDMIENFKEVWDILSKHNLKLILQGHQHLHEELFVKNTWFVTGGAVSAGWWGGAFHGTEEGYIVVNVDREFNFQWKYIDYGWEK